ncbi:MAG: hypothetical protein ACYC3I_09510 [Gemmataceae bacterium]
MLSSPCRYFVLLVLCAAVALPLRSQETPSVKQSASTPSRPRGGKKEEASEKKAGSAVEGKKPAELKKMDLSSLPADAAIILCEHANEALDLVPKAVILRPEKYQALLDKIDQLNKEIENLKIENTTPPTRCLLHGKMESGVVRMQAEFSGIAEHADSVVGLACPQAGASAAETDGRMARIRRSKSGGFLVRIDKPGEYHVKLDLILPSAAREGNGRGFELTLPRAVITQVELDLPANCTDVRVGGQLLKDQQLPGLELKNNRLSGSPGLGPVDKLDLSWKEARQSAADPVRTVQGRIQVNVNAAGLAMEADLWLVVEGGPTKIWRLLVPRNAEIKVLPSDMEARVEHRVETADQQFASLRTIHLKEARSEPLHVQVKLPPLPPRGSALPVGPFFVLDAARQTGTVVVRNQVRNLHLDYRGHGDMQLRRQETEESRGETPATMATLVYSDIPLVEKPDGTTGPRSLSWLDIEAVKVPAQVRLRVSHTLTLRNAGATPALRTRDAFQWEILTTIAPATKWTEVEQLKILVPPEWEPTDENVSVAADRDSRYAVIPFSLLRETPAQTQRLEGRYKTTYKAEDRAVLRLPRPQGTIESCEVKIEASADVEVVLNNGEQAALELSKQPRPNEQTWRCRGAPPAGQGIEVSWRPYRPELRVLSVVDLTLNGSRGEVRHELRLQLPPTPPAYVNLRVPALLGDSLRIQDEQGQEPRAISNGTNEVRRLPVPAKYGGKEWRLVLRYTTRLEENDRGRRGREPFVVPLVVPEQATAGDVKVRIWSEAGLVPRAASPHWEERSIEEVKDRALPVLVLHATKLDAPLRLVLGEQAAGFSVLVERALVRVQLQESGAASFRVSFQLRQLADNHLDILMPAPVATLNALFVFNRHKVTPDFVNDKGELSDGGDVARLHLPSPWSPPLPGEGLGGGQSALLEISVQTPPGRTGLTPLHTILQPPRIRNATGVPIRWQVSVPANRVLLAPESAAGVERMWTWRNWLLAAGILWSPSSFPVPSGERSWDDNEPAALVCWQDQAAPIILTHAPRLAWLLVCSLGLLIVGLGLSWSVRPQPSKEGRVAVWFWPLLAVLTLGFAVAALFWPTLLCVIIYGCEPGAVVLLAVLGVQWLRQEHYRRRVVFLPSFRRSRGGSSLLRKKSAPASQSGEPSTVDAPPPSNGGRSFDKVIGSD